jgi:hypothetical protein
LTARNAGQREGSAYLSEQVSEGAVHAYYTGSSTNLSNSTIFVWLFLGGVGTKANGGFRIVLGDGTNRRAYYVGGSDDFGFFYNGWSCFRLDTANLPTSYAQLLGSAEPTLTAITEVGGGWYTPNKAVGNSDNCGIDIIRYISNGSPALTIKGGGVGTEGTWDDIVTLDESTSNAWGILRRLIAGTNAYELNYGINFGDSAGDSYFEDSDAQIYINGTSMTAGNMDISLVGSSANTNTFIQDNCIFVNVGTLCNWDLSDTNVDKVQITNCQFVDNGTISCPSTDSNKFIRNSIFEGCGLVTVNTMEFDNCKFTNPSGDGITVSSTAWDVINAYFENPGTSSDAAIVLTVSGTYTFDNITFSGTLSTGPYDIDNASGGDVVISVINGGNAAHVINSAGGSTTINNAVTVSISIVDSSKNAISGARVLLEADSGGALPSDASVSITRSGSTATVSHLLHGLSTGDYVIIRGADQEEYNNEHQITVVDSNTYTFPVTGTPASPATGSITSTFRVINGLTDTNGSISTTFNFSADQPIRGIVRKSSSSPYYRQGTITGTITDTGFTTTVVLIQDE